ncbi:FtsW/RodA/SpoVE family cell cycle protein [Gorillibacterium timonense]|uniref:FtsW/RodA/SpoVE family cell cycle protein n=1 Tax=Gorillibacterium timonense TaxID=1689269 RepID=UPI00071D6902|nr:FtsW/RodA/SpoVE family cell cycle protein [Gorillibacterium timonense]
MTLLNKLKRIDWTILFILSLFLILGTMIIFSATMDSPKFQNGNFPKKNVVFFSLGLVVMIAVSLFNYRYLLKFAWPLYGLTILLLVGIYPFGTPHNNALGWYDLKVVEFQPAELAKVVVIITIAAFLVKRRGAQLGFFRDVVPIGLVGGIPFVIIVSFPDLGNAVILLVIMIGLYWVGNIKLSHVLIGVTALSVFAGGFLYLFTNYHDQVAKVMTDMNGAHWVKRIDTFLNPDDTAKDQDQSYQFKNSKKAIGSGGLTGDGYTKGKMVHGNSIPFAYTDTVFVVVAEEFGFVGSSVLLMLYFVLLYRMIMVAMECKDLGGKYLIIGIVSFFVFQIFQHVGMLMGLMPLTGITLPFISYGGTSLLIYLISIGLVLSVRIHQDQPLEE